MIVTGAVTSYESQSIDRLNDEMLKHDFEMLRRVGVRDIIVYGETLRDADNDSPVRCFNYYGCMPRASSTLTAMSMVTRGLLRELRKASVSLHGTQSEHGLCFTFMRDARNLNVTLINSAMPGAECVTRAAPIGLSGIALNERGFLFVSDAYLGDKSLKTLTINRDMAACDRHYARKQAEALVARPAYKDFKIVG